MVLKVFFLFGIFFFLIAIETRVSLAIGIIVFLGTIWLNIPVDVVTIAQRMSSELARSWVLTCVPLFLFLGQIISKSGIAQIMIDVLNIFFNRVPGALAVINVVASFFFGGISGSAAADTASIGGVLIPIMVEEGYPADFSTIVTITSSTLGPIVPPSIIMIVFAWLTETSVTGIFAAGILPGIFSTLTLSLVSIYFSIKYKYGKKAVSAYSFKEALFLVIKGLPVFFIPAIIIGGVLFGIFTATEAASVAVAVSLFLAFFVYRTLKFSDLREMLISSAKMTGTAMIVVVFASALSFLLSFARLPAIVAEIVIGLKLNQINFLLISTLIMIILGCFMNPTAILVMTIPLLFRSSIALGINPIHYALVTTVALAFGHVTPPVGTCLYIGSSISKIPIADLLKPLMPFLLVMFGTLLMLIFVPWISLFIPKLLGYVN